PLGWPEAVTSLPVVGSIVQSVLSTNLAGKLHSRSSRSRTSIRSIARIPVAAVLGIGPIPCLLIRTVVTGDIRAPVEVALPAVEAVLRGSVVLGVKQAAL